MIERVFTFALVLLPFTSIKGLPFLGEIKYEASAYVFLLALGLAVLPALGRLSPVAAGARRAETIYVLPALMGIVLSVILVSFLANFPTIKTSFFQGRGGIEKFVSSTILVLYGFSLAFLTYYVASRKRWDDLIVKPLAVSVMLCAAFSFFEIGGRFNGGLASIHGLLSSVVHGGFDPPEWDRRLRSVGFEPPDFANTAGYIWPWLLAAALAARGAQRALFGGLWLVLNAMIVLSEARTSLVVISGLVAVFLALWFVFLPPKGGNDSQKYLPAVTGLFALLLPSVFLAVGLFYDDMVQAVVGGESVSNLSRLASMVAAFRMFEAQPLFGFGFGQFGFHVTDYMPPWGFLSWEIQLWLFGPIGVWPAVYSVYARFAADMGFLGVAMWVGIWLWLARAILVATLAHRKATGEVPFAAYPLIMSCFCVLLAGIPCDSVRAPMIWVNMGLACRYLYEMRKARQARLAKGGGG